jgi:hypothetical protein
MALELAGQDPSGILWTSPTTGLGPVDWLLAAQLPGGAWPNWLGEGDASATAFAVTALAGSTFVV